MAQAAAIASGYGNRSQLIWRQTDPLFGIAALLWSPVGVDADSSRFDLYVAASIAVICEGDVPDELPRLLDDARELEDTAAGSFASSLRATESPGSVEYLTRELLENNDCSIVTGKEGPDIRRLAGLRHGVQQEWVGSEVSRRRSLALDLEPLLLARIGPGDFRSGLDAAIRQDRQTLRQVLWLLSPDSALTLLLRTAMKGRPVPALAQACGVSPSTITLWKRGGAKPRADRYAVLANALGIEVATLTVAAEDNAPASWPLDPGERFNE